MKHFGQKITILVENHHFSSKIELPGHSELFRLLPKLLHGDHLHGEKVDQSSTSCTPPTTVHTSTDPKNRGIVRVRSNKSKTTLRYTPGDAYLGRH